MFEVKIGGKVYGLEQTWKEFKSFMAADNALDVRIIEARDNKNPVAIPGIQDERMVLHEKQVKDCLRMVNGEAFSGELDDLSYEVPALLAKKLLNPDAEIGGQPQAPFGG